MPVPGAPGVARVPVPSPTLPPASTTNCWLLGDARVIAVDPAGVTDADRMALWEAIGDREVAAILLTHHHGDHVGGAVDLQARSGAPILAHAHTAAKVPFPVDRLLVEGEPLATDAGSWRVLHTPGHARGHLCLVSDDGQTVLAGDMVAGEGTIVLDPPEGELGEYLASLARLQALAPARLLPAHGDAISPALPLIAHYIRHRHARTVQVQATLASAGPSAPLDLVPAIYPDLPAAFHIVAARQVLCHLLWLAGQGAVERHGDTFHPTGATG
jgi:glyoxylase-like metal-dependent hydrolase (beta-lactamase superfamily II)